MAISINGMELSKPGLVILLCATITTLSSGTNYVIGSYAPQLADRLHLTSTQISLVAAAGNWGVYITGPPMGWLADRSGPQAIVFFGALLLGTGYSGLYYAYVNTDPHEVYVPLLAFWSFCTGLGSCAGNTAGLNAVAKSFAPELRGTAIGIVVAGYGLSAFVYATISGYISGDDTAAFLLILAVGTFSSLLGSSIFLTPQRMQAAFSPTSHPSPSPFSSPTTTTALQAAEYRSLGEAREHVETAETILDEDGNDVVGDIEENKAYGAASSHGPPRRRSVGKDDDIGGVGLFKSLDYWMMMLVTFCLTGTGLMWINSVGTIVVTLAEYNKLPEKISRLQSQQTSLLSILNCSGRLFIGFVSDKGRTRFGIRTIWWLVFLSFTFLFSQWLGQLAGTMKGLSWAVAFVGFSYGQFYGLAPLILLEWFGLSHFSSNVGLLYTIPTFSSYTFSHFFGIIYDAHVDLPPISALIRRSANYLPRAPTALSSTEDGRAHICTLGKKCYADIFTFTILACALAVIVSLTLAVRGKGKRNRAGNHQEALSLPGPSASASASAIAIAH